MAKKKKLINGEFYLVKVSSEWCESGHLIMKYEMGYLECEHSGHIINVATNKHEIVALINSK